MLVSICIPCFNASQYLSATLHALLNQTHKNVEIIIVDDHSNDRSIEIIDDFAKKDKRVKMASAEKSGAAAARNKAFKISKGDFVIFFDADDWIPENFIQTQLECIGSNKKNVVVAEWGRFYRNDLSSLSIDPHQIKKDLSFENWIKNYWCNVTHMTCPGRVLIPRILIENAGLWDEYLNLNDDFTFYTRIFSKCTLIKYNSNSTFYYRSGVNGLSSRRNAEAYYSFFKALTRSIAIAQNTLENKSELNICYANLLQNFVYEVYPAQQQLIKQAEEKIKILGGANLKFPAGGITKLLVNLIGWRLTRKLKHFIK